MESPNKDGGRAMMTPFRPPIPKSAYLRLVEHQRNIKLRAYHPDLPLVLFITFSRIAAGLSLVSIFFPPSVVRTGVAFVFMMLATLASIAHLKVPLRFLTMVRNNKSFLVWEIRLAGALAACLGLYFLSFHGYFERFHALFPWVIFILASLFLISTGWAYRFETHPAWKTSILPVYYIVSACMMGLVLRAMYHPFVALPLIYALLLATEAFLLLLYRNHLQTTSSTALEGLVRGEERRTLLAFLWSTLFLPALLTVFLLFHGYLEVINILMAISCSIGIFLERVLFFQVERPVFFLSFIANPNREGRYWIRG